MSALDPHTRIQIEQTLGRPLAEDELVEVGSFRQLTAAEREVARILAERQSALCTVYLQTLTGSSTGATQRFISELRSPRIHSVPAVHITLVELHDVLTRANEAALPPAGVAIALLRGALASGAEETTTLALEAMVAVVRNEQTCWQSGGNAPDVYRKVQQALREDWRRAAEAARESSLPELREAALESLQLLA